MAAYSVAHAQNFANTSFVAYEIQPAQKTHLIGIQQGSSLSRTVGHFRGQGFELSNGETVSFDPWYKTHWQDFQITMLTELNTNFGLIWGLSTGERGVKYRIDPSVQLGFLFHQKLTAKSAWTFSASSRFGGRLKEKTCSADFGQIGGVQTVNCRLAATQLPPEETLQFLLNESPRDRLVLALRYTKQF